MPKVVLGDVEIHPLVQLHRTMPPLRYFDELADRETTRDGWYWRPPYVEADTGELSLDMGGFLLLTGERTILVDAGIGNDKDRPVPAFDHRRDDWLAALAAAGAAAEDVDTVVFTHLHVDHVGYATSLEAGRWVPTFPNAAYLTTAAELEFWGGPAAAEQYRRLGDYFADSVRPLLDAGVVTVVPPDHEVAPGIALTPAAGHTPGNVCLDVRSAGARAVFCGDMVHHPLQLAHPGWSTNFCVDKPAAAVARQRLLAGVADTDTLLVPAHFPGSMPGHVTRHGAGYDWVPYGG
jgi:glyoxylase-like metal-dependent hydrolase (beta-lactamase superfamily II)